MLIYSFIYSIFFLSDSKTFFVILFCEAYKVETLYTHEQWVDLLCTPNTSSQKLLVPLFFFFFLSLQLAKIKNLHLQNCFNTHLMAMAGGSEAAIFNISFKHTLWPGALQLYFMLQWLCHYFMSPLELYFITYNIKSSNSVSKDAFWTTVLRWRKARVVLSCVAGKYSMKPPQPSNHSYILQDYILFNFHHSIFC